MKPFLLRALLLCLLVIIVYTRFADSKKRDGDLHSNNDCQLSSDGSCRGHQYFDTKVNSHIKRKRMKRNRRKRKRKTEAEECKQRCYSRHSDEFFLFSGPTTLPTTAAGYGVFTKKDIPENQIICEISGELRHQSEMPGFKSDKITQIADSEYSIVGDTMCSVINDIVWILEREYTGQDLTDIGQDPEKNFPVYPGFEYNAMISQSSLGRVFVYSTKNISAGSELFVSYGKWYWIPYIVNYFLKGETEA